MNLSQIYGPYRQYLNIIIIIIILVALSTKKSHDLQLIMSWSPKKMHFLLSAHKNSCVGYMTVIWQFLFTLERCWQHKSIWMPFLVTTCFSNISLPWWFTGSLKVWVNSQRIHLKLQSKLFLMPLHCFLIIGKQWNSYLPPCI